MSSNTPADAPPPYTPVAPVNPPPISQNKATTHTTPSQQYMQPPMNQAYPGYKANTMVAPMPQTIQTTYTYAQGHPQQGSTVYVVENPYTARQAAQQQAASDCCFFTCCWTMLCCCLAAD